MRFAIGEFAHETNTFCPGFTELADFRSSLWCEGAEIVTRHRGVRNDLGGMIAAGEQLAIDLVPLLATTTQPSATISRDADETIRDILFARLQAAGPVDAICLALHGAGSADGMEDRWLRGSRRARFVGEFRHRLGPLGCLDVGQVRHHLQHQAARSQPRGCLLWASR